MTKRGFSLMELAVVMGIIAILLIISQPLLREFHRTQNLNSGVNIVVSTLRTTRGKAIGFRKNYRAVFNVTKQAVSIYDNNIQVEGWKKLPDFVVFDTLHGHWRVGNRNGDIFWIEFRSDGSLNNVGIIEQSIVLKEKSTGRTQTIKINPLTGRIKTE